MFVHRVKDICLRHAKRSIDEYQIGSVQDWLTRLTFTALNFTRTAFRRSCSQEFRGGIIKYPRLPFFSPFFRRAANTGDKAIKLWSRAKRETARDVSANCLSLSLFLSLRPSSYLLHPRLPRAPHATFYTQHTGMRLYCRVISGSKPTRRITRFSRFCY